MKKENRWSHGTKNFVLPAWPNDLKGRHGCSLRVVGQGTTSRRTWINHRIAPHGLYGTKGATLRPWGLTVRRGQCKK